MDLSGLSRLIPLETTRAYKPPRPGWNRKRWDDNLAAWHWHHSWLVVNGCHHFGIFPYIYILGMSNHPNWLSLIFFRGVAKNHQPDIIYGAFHKWGIPKMVGLCERDNPTKIWRMTSGVPLWRNGNPHISHIPVWFPFYSHYILNCRWFIYSHLCCKRSSFPHFPWLDDGKLFSTPLLFQWQKTIKTMNSCRFSVESVHWTSVTSGEQTQLWKITLF